MINRQINLTNSNIDKINLEVDNILGDIYNNIENERYNNKFILRGYINNQLYINIEILIDSAVPYNYINNMDFDYIIDMQCDNLIVELVCY